jgi:AcrR family transcriptional regulator
MARQMRSEATRRKILDAAIDVFGEVGYAAAGWGTIIERSGMTKGALYHHFDSKDSLASDIIDEGSATLLNAFRNVCGSSSPGLENLLHGTFAIVKVTSSDDLARTAVQLTSVLSGFNEAAGRLCAGLVELMAAEARRAVKEGDLRDDLDPEVVSKSIAGAMFGTRLLSDAIAGRDRDGRPADDPTGCLSQTWELLLPGIASEASLPYLREFLAREAIRRARPAATSTEAVAAPKSG